MKPAAPGADKAEKKPHPKEDKKETAKPSSAEAKAAEAKANKKKGKVRGRNISEPPFCLGRIIFFRA